MYIASEVILQYTVQGVPYTLATFEVDTADNLPNSLDNFKISIGSKANVIDTGAVYKMGANDTWILQVAGTAAYTKAEVDAIIASLDAPTVGGSSRYISEIYETDGIIHATPANIQTSVNTSNNAVSSNAVKNYVDDGLRNLEDEVQYIVYGLDWATNIPNNTDLDSLTQPGVYRRSSNDNESIGHIPLQGYAFKMVVEYLNSIERIRQTFIPTIASATYYVRVKNNNGWQPWRIFKSIEGNLESGVTLTATAANPLDIHSVTTCGRYAFSTSVAGNTTNLPFSGSGGELIVEQIQGSSRIRQTIIRNDGSAYAGKFWVSFLYSGTPDSSPVWSPWYLFEGTQV